MQHYSIIIFLKQKQKKSGTAVLIIGSTLPPAQTQSLYSFSESISLEVVPQSPANLSADDREMLSGLDLPPDKWDNLNALLAVYKRTENYDVFSVQVSKPGMELSRNYVLQQIEFLLMNSANKESGKIYR